MRLVTHCLWAGVIWFLGGVSLAGCDTYDGSLLLGPSGPEAAGTVDRAAGGDTVGSAGDLPSRSGSGGFVNVGASGAGGSWGTFGGAGVGGASGATPSMAGEGGRAAQGGTAGGSPQAGTSATLELIDDFEDQDQWLLPLHKRNGPWYVFNDGTKAGKEDPLNIALLGAENARDGSLAALHLVASGFLDWGAGVGADFVNSAAKKQPYDVSPYSGIQFYAKVKAGTQATVKLLLPTVYSDPMGGKCNDTVVGKRCDDHLSCTVSKLLTTWATYRCSFADFAQQGFGLAQSELDPQGVYSVQFTLGPKLPADIWIDDVAFVVK